HNTFFSGVHGLVLHFPGMVFWVIGADLVGFFFSFDHNFGKLLLVMHELRDAVLFFIVLRFLYRPWVGYVFLFSKISTP
ncbi:hypothetical protein ACNISP_26720, partial [Escherichia coli]